MEQLKLKALERRIKSFEVRLHLMEEELENMKPSDVCGVPGLRLREEIIELRGHVLEAKHIKNYMEGVVTWL